jgi:hypothetical protein
VALAQAVVFTALAILAFRRLERMQNKERE